MNQVTKLISRLCRCFQLWWLDPLLSWEACLKPASTDSQSRVGCRQWRTWCIKDVVPAVHLDGSGQWQPSISGMAFNEIVVVRRDVALPWLPHDRTHFFFLLVWQVLCEHMKETLHYLFLPRTSFSKWICTHRRIDKNNETFIYERSAFSGTVKLSDAS
jgi:hypothetical protein